MQYIALDVHKRYSFVSVEDDSGCIIREARIEHERGAIQKGLQQFTPGSPVAVETTGNWYWIVDEIEAAGMEARLVNARKAKWMLAGVNKTDRLDCRGMNRLQRSGTLPTVWIPPGELRDQRDLPRTRMVLSQQRTRIKNRIHSTLAKYGIRVEEVTDVFGKRGLELLQAKLPLLPPHSRFATERLLEQLTGVVENIERFESRMREVFEATPEVQHLQTLPGIGFILAVVILVEVGDVSRFPTAAQLAAYSGTTPRVIASGGKVRYGTLRPDVNRYLKWAYMEAANSICMNRRNWPFRHVSHLYERIRSRKGHAKAIGAVARHLAEATYWILRKSEEYQDPYWKKKELQQRGIVYGKVDAKTS